jgi:hypothetical protein
MSVVLLAQRGQLLLDDEVRNYISKLPDYGTVNRVNARDARFDRVRRAASNTVQPARIVTAPSH